MICLLDRLVLTSLKNCLPSLWYRPGLSIKVNIYFRTQNTRKNVNNVKNLYLTSNKVARMDNFLCEFALFEFFIVQTTRIE